MFIRNLDITVPIIYASMQYDSFKIIKSNRYVREKHTQDIGKDPNFAKNFKYHPILVNESGQIIDGQHRFFIAKDKKIPIYYIVQQGADEEDIKTCNIQCGWKSEDYLYHYSTREFDSYMF